MKLRNYRKEYDEYHGSADQRRNRSGRNKARRLQVMTRKANREKGSR